jgi:hypothetical protein
MKTCEQCERTGYDVFERVQGRPPPGVPLLTFDCSWPDGSEKTSTLCEDCYDTCVSWLMCRDCKRHFVPTTMYGCLCERCVDNHATDCDCEGCEWERGGI